MDWQYTFTPSAKIIADFSYSSYNNQWVSMRITLSGGKLYYIVNGDLVGSGSFTKPTADKFYIKSSGTVYLDELRVTTGSLSSTGAYNPSNAPYDTNKVLAHVSWPCRTSSPPTPSTSSTTPPSPTAGSAASVPPTPPKASFTSPFTTTTPAASPSSTPAATG